MFSGIVESTGSIALLEIKNNCTTMTVIAPDYFSDLKIGDSISVNGVCLTIVTHSHSTFTVVIVPETVRKTTLGNLVVGSLVNLERSLKLSDRIGGHIVQGHVDETGKISDIQTDGDSAILIKIQISTTLSKYIIEKGFITIDGMSITVITALNEYFSVTLIPHTRAVTIAKNYCVGARVNLEVDMMAKYVEKIIEARKQ